MPHRLAPYIVKGQAKAGSNRQKRCASLARIHEHATQFGTIHSLWRRGQVRGCAGKDRPIAQRHVPELIGVRDKCSLSVGLERCRHMAVRRYEAMAASQTLRPSNQSTHQQILCEQLRTHRSTPTPTSNQAASQSTSHAHTDAFCFCSALVASRAAASARRCSSTRACQAACMQVNHCWPQHSHSARCSACHHDLNA
jgi:hypothetical protein